MLTPQTEMLDVPGVTDPDAAEMVELPAETPLTRPPVLTVATAVSDDVQVTLVGPVLPSLKVPVAVNCTVHETPATGAEQGEIEADDGVTLMDVNVGLMKNPLQPAASTTAPVARMNPRLDRR